MLERLLGRLRPREAPDSEEARPRPYVAPPAPPPHAATASAAPPPPPPPGYVPPPAEKGLRFRMMFDDGSVATSLEDPEQQEQLGYILKNLLPPA